MALSPHTFLPLCISAEIEDRNTFCLLMVIKVDLFILSMNTFFPYYRVQRTQAAVSSSFQDIVSFILFNNLIYYFTELIKISLLAQSSLSTI